MALNNPYALYFDGVDDYGYVPDLKILGTNQVTGFMGWIKGQHIITSSGSATSEYRAFMVNFKPSPPFAVDFVQNVSPTGWSPVRVYSTIAVNSFDAVNFVAFIYDPFQKFIELYLNDEYEKINISTLNYIDTSPGTVLGRYNLVTKTSFFRNTYDNCSLWNRSLSSTEINILKNKRLKGDEENLLAYYRFDDGSGSIVTDSSPNANHGTIYGATWVPGLVDLHLPGEVPISAALCGSSSLSTRSDHIRGLSAHLTGAATSTGGTPIRIRGLSANLQGAGTTNIRMNLIAALKASLQGKATLKSNILVLFVPKGVYVIDADEIFAKDQPSRGQTVVNHVEVWVNPLKPTEEPEEVYRSKDPVTIPAGKTETVTIHFDDEPVTEPVATLEEAGANLSIVDTKYYAWGADVTIQNTGVAEQTCIIVATGKPLKVQGREVVVKKDEVSIQENGLKKYTFDNPFVQDRATAELIADKLLSFANAKRDIVIEWRGDPALELADVTMIPEYQRRGLDQRGIFYITKQELEFDGGLRAKLEGRKM